MNEDLKKFCIKVTEDSLKNPDNLNYYNGKLKKIGDYMLLALYSDNGEYKIIYLNLSDLNKEYKIQSYFDIPNPPYKCPIVEMI